MNKKKYQDYLIKSLKKPKEAVEYLNAALDADDPQVFLLALRNVSQAFGGVAKVAKKTKLNRTSLYRMLSKKGNPELASIGSILKLFGLKLAVELETQAA